MMVSDDFLERLQKLMEERGLSMAELARLLHTQPSTLTRWFRGSQPQRNTLKQLSEVLRVDMGWLAQGGPWRPLPHLTNVEQTEESNRLMEMPYSYSASPQSSDVSASSLLEVMTTAELIAVAERLHSSPAALSAVLEELRRKTAKPHN